jgi:hypothetical protein
MVNHEKIFHFFSFHFDIVLPHFSSRNAIHFQTYPRVVLH